MPYSFLRPTRVLLLGLVLVTVLTMLTAVPAQAVTTSASAVSAGEHYRGVRELHNLSYERVDGITEHLDLCLPAGLSAKSPVPAIVAVHGGSWAYEDKSEPAWQNICGWLASIGYVTADVDYRLAPEHPYPAALNDVEHAVEWLRRPAQTKRFAINPSRIGAFGGSAGGNLVSLLGTLGSGSTSTGHRVAAVVDMSGPADLTATGMERAQLRPRVLAYLNCATLMRCPQATAASPDRHVDRTDPPFFITNSTDELIPLSQSADFVTTLRDAGVPTRFVTIRGHLHSIAGLSAWLRIRIAAFLHANLPLPTNRGPAR
jgi:acetyl esterase